MLRRAKSGINPNTRDGATLLEDAERIENWAVIVVIGAITIEGFLVFVSNETWFFKIGDFIASGAVAIAILIELKFGGVVAAVLKARLTEAEIHLIIATEMAGKAGQRAAELEKEAAEIRERAAKLEAELIPRRLTDDAQEKIRERLSPFAGTPFTVAGDPAAELSFQNDLVGAILRAGWKWMEYSAPSMTLLTPHSSPGSGVQTRVSPAAPPPISDAALALTVAVGEALGQPTSRATDPGCSPDAVHLQIFRVR